MLKRIPEIVLLCMCQAMRARAQTDVLPAGAPPGGDMQGVVERLDRLEKQNRELIAEIRELRRLLQPVPSPTARLVPGDPSASPAAGPAAADSAAPTESGAPTNSERLAVQESRTDELSQTKVGTLQRVPVWLTGMVLFNAFHNGGFGGTAQYPVSAQLTDSPASTGASFRQTVIGLRFDGPDLPGGGKAGGSAYFDFWGGTAAPGNNLFRVRTATIDLTWKNTTITAGQDKPIVSPREPTSLAQVGLAPLAGAGNLWDWQPQLRIEQRFVFGQNAGNAAGGADAESVQTGMRVQAGVYETSEAYPSSAPTALSGTLERQRPAWEGRLLFYHGSEKKRVEIAPGIHFSDSHVAGQSVGSRLATVDWLVKPSEPITFSGAFFRGTDDAGLGGLRQGFTILPSGDVIPVHGTGGWGQLALFPASRVTLHLFGGEEADRASDLTANSIRFNLTYAANIVYKLAPNVLAAMEASQTRTDYISSGLRLNNHYDLALAYLF
jgi:hypothetical protein